MIEYDGYPWHDSESAMQNDPKKDFIAIKKGYKICRLRDYRLKINNKLHADIWTFVYDGQYKYFAELPIFLRKYIFEEANLLDINVVRDSSKIHIHYMDEQKRKSLIKENPSIEKYIDYEDTRNGNPNYIFTQSHKLSIYMRHPKYPGLKWSYTAHELFGKKGDPMPQAIKMCVKLLKMYPELEEQICTIGMDMREDTIIDKKCDVCGKLQHYKYTQLYYAEPGKKMCPKCLKKFRLKNLSSDNK